MPELPEVEVSKRIIKPYIFGYTILYTRVYNINLRWPISNELINIKNQIVIDVIRRAKYILLELTNGFIIIHLGMSGKLEVLHKNIRPRKHDHIDFVMNNNVIIRYNDSRKFGSLIWSHKYHLPKNILNLGVEPLSDDLNYNWFCNNIRNKNSLIKPLLMSTKWIVGIGNIYANEILFASKIMPTRIIRTLDDNEVKVLIYNIKKILLYAINLGGSTINNFSCNQFTGMFSKKLQVYGRYNSKCNKCMNMIKTIRMNNRSTFFCDICQK
ncbi:MAG: bifunctional DNA-formamidopyrimidine glycosylase/DNA-(apurinic or apyrimidinic site) lyase [Candidatus Lightella neohaematopini]|nr:bifunctional DNA-formamidopyrimidine glycosylase/DNA-(apurinic or apyrimidinic site) lyase [Candidatus Lightella neohaematopini]